MNDSQAFGRKNHEHERQAVGHRGTDSRGTDEQIGGACETCTRSFRNSPWIHGVPTGDCLARSPQSESAHRRRPAAAPCAGDSSTSQRAEIRGGARRRTVAGLTITRAIRQPLQVRDSPAQSHRSAFLRRTRRGWTVAAPAVDSVAQGLRGARPHVNVRRLGASPERTSAGTSSRNETIAGRHQLHCATVYEVVGRHASDRMVTNCQTHMA
jgi:hypothetical protein